MRILSIILAFFLTLPAVAQDQAPCPEDVAMNNQRLLSIIERIAPDIEGEPGFWRFSVENFVISIITDETADRMRIMIPVAELESVGAQQIVRLMQANFDTALDARYAIANGIIWSTFIHPLSELSDAQLTDGLAQTVNLAATYGSSYSSGALVYRGGDSRHEQDKYYRAIIELGNSI